MAIVVNTNVQSLIGQNSLNKNTNSLNNVMEKLSTGLRINSSKDDAAGVGVAERMTSQIRGNSQAMNNIQDALNLLNTAEGGLTVITDNVQRIRELCIQAANEIYDKNSKQAIMNEIKQRLETVETIALTSNFNGKQLLDGTIGTQLWIQTGPNGDTAAAIAGTGGAKPLNAINVAPSLTKSTTGTDGLDIALNITALNDDGTNKTAVTTATAQTAAIDGTNWTSELIRNYITKLDGALTKIANAKSVMGSYMNAMESASENLTITNQSLSEARSRIQDVDVAQASSDMVRYQILQQTSSSLLAQANQLPSIAMTLLGG